MLEQFEIIVFIYCIFEGKDDVLLDFLGQVDSCNKHQWMLSSGNACFNAARECEVSGLMFITMLASST